MYFYGFFPFVMSAKALLFSRGHNQSLIEFFNRETVPDRGTTAAL